MARSARVNCGTDVERDVSQSVSTAAEGKDRIAASRRALRDKPAARVLRRTFWGLLFCETLLVGGYLFNISIGNPVESLGALIDLDRETAVGTWLSSTQLFVIGVLFLGLWLPKYKRRVDRLFLILGVGFIYLSIDETAAVHEKITGILKRFSWAPRVAGNHGLWIPVYLGTVVIVLLIFRKSIATLLRRYTLETWLFAGGATLVVLGGIFIEMLGYYHVFEHIPALGIAMEELGELAGESLMILGVARCYLKERGL